MPTGRAPDRPCCRGEPWGKVVAVSRKKTALTRLEPDYEAVLTDVVELVEAARHLQREQ